MRRTLILVLGLLLAAPAHAGEEPAPPSIEELASKLGSEDPGVRRQAAWNLWQRRADAGAAAAALAGAIRDEDEYVRETSAKAVRYLLIRAPEAVPELVRGLTDERLEVRRLASEMLAWCYEHVAGARAELMAALAGDADAVVRANAANSLRLLPPDQAGPAIPVLVKATEDPDPVVRIQAVMALAWLHAPETSSVVARTLGDQDARVRERTLEALRWAGDLPDWLAGRAAEMLHDEVPTVRRRAAFVLGRFPDHPEIAVPALLGAIRDEAVMVRIAAAVALRPFSKGDAEVRRALAEALAEGNYYVTQASIAGLKEAGPRAAPQLPDLARVIQASGDKRLRYAAADAIDAILGAGIEEAVEALEAEAFREPDYSSIRAAAVLLRLGVNAEENRRSLLDALRDETLGSTAARLLGSLRKAAQPAIPELVELAKAGGAAGTRADYVLVRVAVLDAEEALGRLRAALEDPEGTGRIAAVGLLGLLGADAAPAVPELTKLLATPDDPALVSAVVSALRSIGPPAREALPALRKLAEGPPAREALPALRKLAEGRPSACTALAQEAIRKITGEDEKGD